MKSTTELTQPKKQVILRRKPSGVGLLLFDCPGKVNLLTSAVMYELGRALEYVAQDEEMVGLAIASGKHDTFLSGADLHEITRLREESTAYELSRQGQMCLNLLAGLDKPTVVGINGHCLGGGLELALCCDRRIATNHPRTLIGLPEVKMGIIPGLGGTQRLPRLIGVKGAIEIALSGDPVTSARALEMGIVDELVDPDDLLARLEQVVLQMVQDAAEPGQAPSFVRKPKDELPADKQKQLFAMAERSVRIRTRGNYPAHSRVLEVMRDGLAQDIDAALDLEAHAFGQLAVSDVSRNLVALFFTTEFTRQSAAALAAKPEYARLKTIGVVGSGKMGAAIAHVAAAAGFDVILRASSQERAHEAIDSVRSLIARGGQKPGQESGDTASALARIRAVSNEDELASADAIIEASVEDVDVKRAIFEHLAEIVGPDCILATNTSSLSVAEIAQPVAGRERVLGLHFFNPVDRMALVEVVSHKDSSREHIGKAVALVARLGKTPLTVGDGPGFFVNRVLCCYLLEAARLAEELTPLNWIEDAARAFGMPMGPLELVDEVGWDIALKVAHALNDAYGDQFPLPDVVSRVEALGVTGKTGGRGLYLWDESGKKQGFDPRLFTEVGLTITDSKAGPEASARISERLILPMVDEAARCLQEKVVKRAREVDLGMVMGIGFPAFRGGLLRYADSLGIQKLRAGIEHCYAESKTTRQVSEQILKLEANRRRFYAGADGD